MPLRRPLPKKLTPVQQRLFWRRFNAGEVPEWERRRFAIGKTRAPLIISPTLLGTVRRFTSTGRLKKFLLNVRTINHLGASTKFETFEFQPTQILSVDGKNMLVLERVYRAPNAMDLARSATDSSYLSPFCARFWKRMQEKKIAREQVVEALQRTYLEIIEKWGVVFGREQRFDPDPPNFLVLDFDEKTGKPLLAIVDHSH